MFLSIIFFCIFYLSVPIVWPFLPMQNSQIFGYFFFIPMFCAGREAETCPPRFEANLGFFPGYFFP